MHNENVNIYMLLDLNNIELPNEVYVKQTFHQN